MTRVRFPVAELFCLHFAFDNSYVLIVALVAGGKRKKIDLLPRGLEPRTLGLLDLRSDQLSYESPRSKCKFTKKAI